MAILGFENIGHPDPANYNLQTLIDAIPVVARSLTGFAASTAVVAIVWGAIKFLIAGGNEEKARSGKTIITWALVGLIVIALSRAFVIAALRVLEPTDTNRLIQDLTRPKP